METIQSLAEEGRPQDLVLQPKSYLKVRFEQTRALFASPLVQVVLLLDTLYRLTSNSSRLLKMTTSVFKLRSSKASIMSLVFMTLLELVLTAHVALVATQPLVWMQNTVASVWEEI